jgi:hypothetical protein
MQRPVAPQHRRYRAEQPRGCDDLAAAATCMAPPSSDSQPPCFTPRPPVADLQPSEEREPEAGTPESDDHQAAGATRSGTAEAEKKKDSRAAEDAAPAPAGGGSFGSAGEESARERLKRHRTEVAGRVRIPDMWGQECLLKDWVDCAVFDRPLAATAGLLNARDALVAARRPAARRPLRVQNGCS